MASTHTVADGDCLSSLTQQYQFRNYQAIYDHTQNARLKRLRPNPNVLFPTDRVFIPDPEQRAEDRPTTQVHQFEVPRYEVQLRIVLQNDDAEAYARKRYELRIDTQTYRGNTTAEGLVEQTIPANARAGTLLVFLDAAADSQGYEFPLEIGSLHPVEETTGVKARLNNLGFDCGAVNGTRDARLQEAVRGFQAKHGIRVTGTADTRTRNRLRELHEGA